MLVVWRERERGRTNVSCLEREREKERLRDSFRETEIFKVKGLEINR